jgi:Ca2+-binding RTX toxin-like protein
MHRKRRINRSYVKVFALLALGGAIAFGAISHDTGHAADPSAMALEQGLQNFATSASALATPVTADTPSHLNELASQLPLSSVNPFTNGSLSLQNVFSQALAASGADLNNVQALASHLESEDTTLADGVTAQVGCPTGQSSCSGGDNPVSATQEGNGSWDLTIPIKLTRALDSPVHLPTDATDIEGTGGNGSVHVALLATTTLQAHFDPSNSDPNSAFTITPPTLDVGLDLSTPSPLSFPVDLGFTKITVGGSISTAHLGLTIAFQSPHAAGTTNAGQFTAGDLTTSSLEDLVQVSRSASFSAQLTFDTDLLPQSGNSHALTIDIGLDSSNFTPTFQIDGSGSPVSSLSDLITSSSLVDFTKVTPAQIIGGVGQLAASIQSLQNAANIHLPMVSGGLGNTLTLVNQLSQALSQQTVVCGNSQGNPPTGPIAGLPQGTTIYCQAVTSDTVHSGTHPTWNVVLGATAGANTSGAAADGTVGIGTGLTTDAQFTTTQADVPPVVTVSYTADDAQHPGQTIDRAASQPIPTAQDLFNMLTNTAGFSTDQYTDSVTNVVHLPSSLKYDSNTHILSFHLLKVIPLGVQQTYGADIGDTLSPSTGTQNSGSQAGGGGGNNYKSDASGLIGLTDHGSSVQLNAQNVVLDLTFGVVLTDDPSTISTHSSTPTSLDRFFVQSDGTKPILSIDSASLTANLNLVGTLGFLRVSATNPDSGPALSIAPDDNSKPILALNLTAKAPSGSSPDASTSPAGFDVGSTHVDNAVTIPDLLSNISGYFALTPNLHISGGIKVTADGITDGTGNPLTGGVSFDWPGIDSLDKIQNLTGLQITPDTTFIDQLKGFFDSAQNDPQAFLTALLNMLSQFSKSIGGSGSGGLMDTSLPLIGTTPRKLLQPLQTLQQLSQELSGAPGPQITCKDVTQPSLAANKAANPDVLNCQVTNLNEPTPNPVTNVQWSVNGGDTLTNDTDVNTIGDGSSDSFGFTVSSGVSGLLDPKNTTGFAVHVKWTDQSGTHSADLPSVGAPPTLQDFADVLAMKLGLPQGSIGLKVQDTTPQGGSSEKVVRLTFTTGACAAVGGITCGSTDAATDPLDIPLNAKLTGLSGGIGLSSTGDIKLGYKADVTLDVGVPIDGTTEPVLFGDTGASIGAAFNDSTSKLTASVGPLSLILGDDGNNDGSKFLLEGAGGLKLSGPSGGTADDSYSFSDFASGVTLDKFNGTDPTNNSPTPLDCGTWTDNSNTQDESGAACGIISLAVSAGGSATRVGDLGVRVGDFLDPSTINFDFPANLGSDLANAIFNPDFLLHALPSLLDKLKTTLTNAGNSIRLPIIGNALDAGANVVDQLNQNLVQPVINGLDSVLPNPLPTDPKTLHDDIQKYLFDQLKGSGLLLGATSTPAQSDVNITLTCSSGASASPDCSSDGTANDDQFITDARVSFYLGQGVADAGSDPGDCMSSGAATCISKNLPFDIGVNGLPLRLTGSVNAGVGWKVKLDFGLSKDLGPYLVENNTQNGDGTGSLVPAVQVGAYVGLGDSTHGGATCENPDPSIASTSNFGDFLTSDRCLEGTLGFINVKVTDGHGTGDAAPTHISLLGSVFLTDPNDSTKDVKVGVTDIIGGSLAPEFQLKADAAADLLFHAGITGTGTSFPSVWGELHAAWSWSAGSQIGDTSAGSGDPSIGFDNLNLDAGSFVSNYLTPIVKQIQSVTSPFKPVLDVITAPIPVVSQLAQLVGQPPVTLLGVAEAIGGNDLSFIDTIVKFINFVNNFHATNGEFLIPLGSSGGGSFNLDSSKVEKSAAPDQAGNVIDDSSISQSNDVLDQISSQGFSSPQPAPAAAPANRNQALPSAFGVPGLTFPFIQQPSNLFKLLMGQDVTLVDFQFGPLVVSAGFNYSFGPFLIGPVPVSVILGGSVGLTGHLGIGYDTTGLREIIGGAGPAAILDGLFFDTNDAQGNPTPILSLQGTVTAGAEVDLEIVKAGIEAGLTLTTNFFFDDPTPGDGKMSFQDIGQRLANPICLFKITGSLDAFIRAFVEFDFFIGSVRADWTILTLHLLDFSQSCEDANPPPPEPANFDPGTGHLTLNIGQHSGDRHYQSNVTDEVATVKPVSDGGESAPQTVNGQTFAVANAYSVTVLGVTKVYGDATHPVTKVIADGDDGNDKIQMADGADVQCDGCEQHPLTLRFTAPVLAYGGTGDDTIVGGWGNDHLFGGRGPGDKSGDDGSDNISGGAGNDVIVGGNGASTLSGDAGDDYLCAGHLTVAEDDTVNSFTSAQCTPGTGPDVMHGGAGADHMFGSNGADVMDGGPALDPAVVDPASSTHQTFGVTQPDAVDGNDYMVGNGGPDTLTGGPGNDTISGDEDLGPQASSPDPTCTAADVAPTSAGEKNDIIDAGTGDDFVWAGAGDDQVKAGSGSNWVCGGDGNDTITADGNGSSPATNVLLGGPGTDTITGGPSTAAVNLIDGGADDDTLTGGAGQDLIIGGDGKDNISGAQGDDILIGDNVTISGKDESAIAQLTLAQVPGFITAIGNNPTDRASHITDSTAPDAPTNADTINGGPGDDTIFGGPGADNLSGVDGNDYVDGGSGNDTMSGGDGNDIMYGRAGDDVINGNSGDDTMYGDNGPDGSSPAPLTSYNDTMFGGDGNDYIEGNFGADTISGGSGDDHILGGSSMAGMSDQNTDLGDGHGAHGDIIDGADGNDVIVGDNGSISNSGAVVVFDSCGLAGGDDTISGSDGNDALYGGNGNDTMSGGNGNDYMEGNGGNDTMIGDAGDDHMLGGSSSDTSPGGGAPQSYTLACDGNDNMSGATGNDVMLGDNGIIAADGTTSQASSLPGTFGNDTMQGGDGQDQMYGELGSDTMTGDAGEDYMLGDLGSITAPGSGPAVWPGGAPNYSVTLISPDDANSGQDVMYGGPADDHMYGGGGNDTMQGGAGDDYMEGNGGQDSMYGRDDGIDGSTCSNSVSIFDCAQSVLASTDTSADQDDMIGGSSGANPLPTKLDAGELIMKGNLGQDVMIGDNGTITRTVDPADPTKWAQDPITGGAKRTVTLTYSDLPDCSTGVCGNDTMEGDAGNDRIYGEGGDDTIDGDATNHGITGLAGDDYVEGNQGTDTIHGNDGNDDLIGGSSEIASGSGDAAVGRPDTGDNIFGDGGADVIAGDNAVVNKLGPCPNGGVGDPITQRPGMSDCQRTIRLLDLTVGSSRTSTPGTFGDDTISGGDANDVIFGQAGNDTIHGDNGDDYIEGNQGTDTIYGDAGQDDIIGGSSHIFSGSAADKSAVGEADTGDTIFGGDDQDVVIGDNGAILRIGTTNALTRANTLEDATKNRDGMAQRTIALYDLGDTPTLGNSGGDYIEGNGGSDVLLGEDGNDRIKGGAGNDYIEGNQGTDALEGNDGDDDVIGGSSTPLTGVQAAYPTFVAPAAPTDATTGQPDQGDQVFGGAGDDLITGDNAVTSRVGGTASFLLNRISTTNPGNLVTPRFLQLLDLKNGGSYLTLPALTRFGADWISAGSGNDVAFGQDGNDAISGGGGDDYIEGNGGQDVIRGDLLLTDTPPNDPGRGVPVVNTPETPQVAPPNGFWPGAQSSGSDLDGTGATPAGQDDIIGGSSIPGFRDTGDIIEGDGEADFVLGDNGTLARDVQGSPGSLTNTVFTARYPAGAAPANAVIIRHHDPAENVKYGTSFTSTRFCTQAANAPVSATCEVPGAFGDDHIYGDAGDDTLWGQDGNDWMRGGDGNDDMYGESGQDRMFGDEGQDAMLGDRGGIVDTYINGTPGGNSTDARFPTTTITLNNPPAITYTDFIAGTVDRRVDLLHDIDGASFVGSGATNPMPLNGASFGDNDVMRGGDGKDTMHGGYGDDIMNGDSGGDTLYGDDGADVIWGGRGCDPASRDDPVPAGQSCNYPNSAADEGTPGAFLNTRNSVETVPGTNTTFTLFDGEVDYMFGGHGGTSPASIAGASGADIIDWRPRGTGLHPGPGSDPNSTCANDTLWPAQPGTAGKKTPVPPIDPCEWLIDTNTNDDPAVSANPATDPTIQNNQTHQGIDWEYGGWDRDVLQADVADNGPNPGDRLDDWNGTYNLYTHCNSAYGGYNDVRNSNPATTNFILTWAMATGAGQIGTNDIGTPGTSAFDEVAFVYNSDNNANSGQNYPTTPGHFDAPNSCGL